MAFEFKLSDDEIREKMFDFIKPVYKSRWDPEVYCINWIYGVYDSENGIFITYVNTEQDKYRYVLITRNGDIHYVITNPQRHIISELPDELSEYAALIEDGISLYNYGRQEKSFCDSFSEVQKEHIRKISENMEDRCKPSVEINSYEDAEKFFYQEHFSYYTIVSEYNKKTVANFDTYMSDERMRTIRGEQYREILSKILAYDNRFSEEENKNVSREFKDAGVLSVRGMDDIYVERTFEAIKKGYQCKMNSDGWYLGFIVDYIKGCIRQFPDKIQSLRPILDFVNKYMKGEKYVRLDFYRKELEKLIYQKTEGFQFVLTTEELREKMFYFLKGSSESYWLNAKNINWTSGVYNKESGIFLTQVKYSGDGLCDEVGHEYIVMLDNGESFYVSNTYDIVKSKYYFGIPKQYEGLTKTVKEGMDFYYGNELEYRFTLSEEIREELEKIKNGMNDRWQQIVSRNREKRASERANVSKKTKKHNKKRNTVISVICNIFDFMDGLNCEFEKKSWILLLIGICSIIIEIILLQYIL